MDDWKDKARAAHQRAQNSESAPATNSNGKHPPATDQYPVEERGNAWEGDDLPKPVQAVDAPAAYRAFPVIALPEPIRGYVDTCAKSIGCDPAYVALPMLSTLAGVIGNTRCVRLKGDWTEPAIIWTAIIGYSGQQKSPALDTARRFPRRRQTQARKRHAEAIKIYQEDSDEYKAALAEWKKKPVGDKPEGPTQPVLERALVDDTTIEALGPILQENERGVLILRDELAGWLGCFDRYAKSPRGGGEAAKWIEMHGGRSISIDRRTGVPRTLFVPRAAVSISGGIQPGILRQLITPEHKASGLFARLLMCMPPRKPRRWTECEPDESIIEVVQHVYDWLWELVPSRDRDGEPTPIVVPLNPAAQQEFIRFVNEHGLEQFRLDENLAAAWSKLEGYAARLALIHHLVRVAAGDRRDPESGIDVESMRAGIELVRWFCTEDRRIYAMVAEDAATQDRRELVDLIRRHGGYITVRRLQRSSRNYATAEIAEAALKELALANLGAWETLVPQRGGHSERILRLLGQ